MQDEVRPVVIHFVQFFRCKPFRGRILDRTGPEFLIGVGVLQLRLRLIKPFGFLVAKLSPRLLGLHMPAAACIC